MPPTAHTACLHSAPYMAISNACTAQCWLCPSCCGGSTLSYECTLWWPHARQLQPNPGIHTPAACVQATRRTAATPTKMPHTHTTRQHSVPYMIAALPTRPPVLTTGGVLQLSAVSAVAAIVAAAAAVSAFYSVLAPHMLLLTPPGVLRLDKYSTHPGKAQRLPQNASNLSKHAY